MGVNIQLWQYKLHENGILHLEGSEVSLEVNFVGMENEFPQSIVFGARPDYLVHSERLVDSSFNDYFNLIPASI